MFYAVKQGRRPGIYDSWPECQREVAGYPGAEYKSFKTFEVAHSYLTGKIIGPKEGLVCDGGCKGNPGPISIRVVDLGSREIIHCTEKGRGTNNQAEIWAMVVACKLAPHNIDIYTDSQLVLYWTGGKDVKAKVAKRWFQRVQQLIERKSLTIKKWDKILWGENPADCK